MLPSSPLGAGTAGWDALLSRCRKGTGSRPLRSRSRTSLAVPGEIPARVAISRIAASGFCAMRSLAMRRPAAGLTGRTLPSRPIRSGNCGISALIRRRIDATVLSESPAARARARSDHCGLEQMMRTAAAIRSARDSGSPCATFSRTASRNASSSAPSNSTASMYPAPPSIAARTRCIPSITRIVDRCTTIGGSSSATSARTRTCLISSPLTRNQLERTRSVTGTRVTGYSLRSQSLTTWSWRLSGRSPFIE